MRRLRVGIIGFGKIAADQHAPAIAANPRLELAATVSRSGNGLAPSFPDHREMLRSISDLDAVAITTPPGPRYAIARDCIEAGLHCLLEKPPTVTVSEIEDLACLAEGRQVSLFTAWHARHHPAVAAAARLLAGKRIASMEVAWREDVRKWHPGQQWIWDPGGFGVFDPGINAFSIVTNIFPGALFVEAAELVFPANRDAPIAAGIRFSSPVADGALMCALDWRHEGDDAWNIRIVTSDGVRVDLTEGGSRLAIDGVDSPCDEEPGEYPDIYREFVDLIDSRRGRVDPAPLRLVADAFLLARRTECEAFADQDRA